MLNLQIYRIVKPAVNAPAVVETETVQTRKSDGTAAAIGSGTNATYYCYQCNSATMGEEDCDSADSEALSKFNKPCTGVPKGSSIVGVTTAVQCRKIQQEVEGEQKRIIRECAYTGDEELDGKKRTGNKGVYMYFYTCINSMAVSLLMLEVWMSFHIFNFRMNPVILQRLKPFFHLELLLALLSLNFCNFFNRII